MHSVRLVITSLTIIRLGYAFLIVTCILGYILNVAGFTFT